MCLVYLNYVNRILSGSVCELIFVLKAFSFSLERCTENKIMIQSSGDFRDISMGDGETLACLETLKVFLSLHIMMQKNLSK